MQNWFYNAQPRPEVREGRSFNPDEFAIALEQVAAGRGPEDYRDAAKFFARTCFTRALNEHLAMVLRRLAGETQNSAPVMTLVTQFGGGKTHTLTALYHLARNGAAAAGDAGVRALLAEAGVGMPAATPTAVFVGNAWDPREGAETPWLDVARQLAGERGVAALGPQARTVPPGTDAIARMIEAAGGAALVLFDEVLNYLNRHREGADHFHAFLQNLTVALTGTTRAAAVISLPRSQVEMAESDYEWQEKINKLVRRVARDLIANDEAEISEVIRKRLFDSLGSERIRRSVATHYADWCFERRAQLPPEWTIVDTSVKDAKARDLLRERFEACYPFHPATISVFQRKWRALPQFQQTRGALAMFAQWISIAYRDGHRQARKEPLLTLGSAPLEDPGFRAAVLGQLGESRLQAAIEADASGPQSHARALDSDARGALADLHQRVATTIFFESSGGQKDAAAHLPELRFALGAPGVETGSIDNAASALEARCYYVRRRGTDGFALGYKPTLKKIVNDRRASLDELEVAEETLAAVRREFERADPRAGLPVRVMGPEEAAAVEDAARLRLYALAPEMEWTEDERARLGTWTGKKGHADRAFPAALLWSVRKPGRDLGEAVGSAMAWRRAQKDLNDGTLAGEFSKEDRQEVADKVRAAEAGVVEQVWACYRFVVLADASAANGVEVIDLGAGHASAGETPAARVLAALRSRALLNDAPGASYLERKWPQPFRENGAWPMISLRQAFLNGTLDRVLDPDAYLRARVPMFVLQGDFGYASGRQGEGEYQKVWFREALPADEVAFDADVYLLSKREAGRLKQRREEGGGEAARAVAAAAMPIPEAPAIVASSGTVSPSPSPAGGAIGPASLRVSGEVPAEIWNKLGRTLLPKLNAGGTLRIGVEFELETDTARAKRLEAEVGEIVTELGLGTALTVRRERQ